MSKYKILTTAVILAGTLTACGREVDNGISPISQISAESTVMEVTEKVSVTTIEVRENAEDVLDEETAEMLRTEFAKYIGETDPLYARFDPSNVRIETYYGKYNGCEVFLPLYRNGYDAAEEYYYVAGYGIFFPCLGYDIYVHKDGTFYELADAYEKGYISEGDVAEIAEIQNGTPPEKTDPSETDSIGSKDRENMKLRRAKDVQFRSEFMEFLGETAPEYAYIELSNVKIEPYCTTDNGWEAFQPLYKDSYDDSENYFSVAGYEMYFPCLGYEIYVYKDGDFYELSEAYENGFISEADVAQIAEANHIRYFFAFV